ncbi:hypothetical protein DNFV4_00493 [Nitrospira tepida]|uniref:Uncharacterized protein n=1 Tax=Nitrospira tepida TaxID=2973512 RepID=A0AA86MW52_9BACT|nr:hypothetical protein [Nitrospira tepida]CAI4030069.1 hypothetical protein DNFV4_00493 [Nitrospira tepida]
MKIQSPVSARIGSGQANGSFLRKRVTRHCRAFVLLLIPVLPALGLAEETVAEWEPGKLYRAGVRVSDPATGGSFVIPSEWEGRVPPGSDALLLGSERHAGVGVVALMARTDRAELKQKLSEPQDFGGEVILQLSSPLEEDDRTIRASYLHGNVVGRACAVMGPEGRAIVFFLAGPASDADLYERLLSELASSTTFEPVATT